LGSKSGGMYLGAESVVYLKKATHVPVEALHDWYSAARS